MLRLSLDPFYIRHQGTAGVKDHYAQKRCINNSQKQHCPDKITKQKYIGLLNVLDHSYYTASKKLLNLLDHIYYTTSSILCLTKCIAEKKNKYGYSYKVCLDLLPTVSLHTTDYL